MYEEEYPQSYYRNDKSGRPIREGRENRGYREEYDRYEKKRVEPSVSRDRDRRRDRSGDRDRERLRSHNRDRDRHRDSERGRSKDKYRNKQDDGVTKEKEIRREQANRERAIGALPVMAIPQGSTIILRARRLYVENLPEETKPDDFIEFINKECKDRHVPIKPGDPALALDVGHDGQSAYLEFRTSEECDAALILDGVEFNGQKIKITRPNDYQPHNGYYFGCPHVFQDTLNKLFVACIPIYLSDDQVRELLTAFGELKAFNLVKDGASGLSKGYAFCEYRDGTVTDIAISGLNGMQIADKKLVVQRAVLGSRAGTNLGGIIPSQMQVPGVDPDHIISHDLLVTEVLCLINCLVRDDLENDQEYEEILWDVRQECSKYGEVLAVEIPRYDPDKKYEHLLKIFVEFADKEQCKEAHEALAGRKFKDRMVLTTFYDTEKFHRREI